MIGHGLQSLRVHLLAIVTGHGLINVSHDMCQSWRVFGTVADRLQRVPYRIEAKARPVDAEPIEMLAAHLRDR